MALHTNLVFGLKLDEVSGDRRDYVGNAVGTDVNTVGSTAGKIGLAARFVQANSEQLNFGALQSLLGGPAASWALCGFTRWTNPAGTSDLIVTRDTTNNRGWQLDRSAANTLRFLVFNGVTTIVGTASATCPTSGWFFWAVTFNKDASAFGDVGIRINNAAFVTANCSATLGVSSANVRFGNRDLAGGTFLDGDLDLVYAWRGRVPSNAEFDQVYNSGNGLVIPVPRGHSAARRIVTSIGRRYR